MFLKDGENKPTGGAKKALRLKLVAFDNGYLLKASDKGFVCKTREEVQSHVAATVDEFCDLHGLD